MKRRIYVETTVVSYLTARPGRDVIQLAHQASTEQWWREQRPTCEVFVSELVVEEAGQGDPEAVERRLAALANIPRLPLTQEVLILARMLMAGRALPSNAEDDAVHVALASAHGMDVLLTWNCRHIANVIALPRIREIIQKAGFRPPEIATPENLLESLGD